MKYQFEETIIESEEDLRGMSGAKLVELYNEVTGESLKKFADKDTAVARLMPILESIAPAVQEQPAVRRAGRRPSIPDTATVEVLSDGNPFRSGCNVHSRWENVDPKTGDTIGDLKKRGLTGGDIRWCLNTNKSLTIQDAS